MEKIEKLTKDITAIYDTLESLPQSYDNGDILAENLSILVGILPRSGKLVAEAEKFKNVKFSQSDKSMYEKDKEYYKLSVKSSTNHQQNIAGYDGTEVYIELYQMAKNLYSDIGTTIEAIRSLLKNIQFEIEHGIREIPKKKFLKD